MRRSFQKTINNAIVDSGLGSASVALSVDWPSPGTLITFPPRYWSISRQVCLEYAGRISTTAGATAAQFAINLVLSAGSTVMFQTNFFNLVLSAKTNVPFWLKIWLTGIVDDTDVAGAKVSSISQFQSETVIGSPAPSAGGNGKLLGPPTVPTPFSGFNGLVEAAVRSEINMFSNLGPTGVEATCHQFAVHEEF